MFLIYFPIISTIIPLKEVFPFKGLHPGSSEDRHLPAAAEAARSKGDSAGGFELCA